MKDRKMTMLKIRWKTNYIMRTTLSALKVKSKKARANIGVGLNVAWAITRRAWSVGGYYISLGALLVLVGVAAHAYRSKPLKVSPQSSVMTQPMATNEAVWSNLTPQSGTPKQTQAPFSLCMPVGGDVVQDYVTDTLLWSDTLQQWQTHPGIDFAAEMGEVVCASEAGEVIGAYKDALLGSVIEIRHENGYITKYGALNTLALVEVGQKVEKGETISSAGNSAYSETDLGTHVHFELIVEGSSVQPEFEGMAEAE